MQMRSVENELVNEDKLEFISNTKVRSVAPDLFCVASLYSPATGIFDSHSYMLNLIWDT
jgi:L-2-hydroxyglutarate oxidase LhgO